MLGRNLGWLTVTGPSIGPDTPVKAEVQSPDWKGSRVQAYRRLGRTNFEVSDISLGSGRIKGEEGERVRRSCPTCESCSRQANRF